MKRSFSETLSLCLVLIIMAQHAFQAWTFIAWRAVLAEFSVTPNPLIGASFGIFWTGVGLTVCAAIWQRKAWAGKLLIGTAIGYVVWYWGERLLWLNPQANISFSAIVTLVFLIVVYLASKSLSREAYERNIEHPKTK